MNTVDTQSLLLQMRSLAAQAQTTPLGEASALKAVEGGKPENFAELLTHSIEAVNQQQNKSKDMKDAFERGDPDVELSEVMLQAQKASLSFQAMTQVRNKLVEAYKEVIQMPI
ncbi:flagellar hook-basal body complex protein FliE [Thiosulfatimonas sediminis]|uniref:Flagellar hook-basal body complex protein FliE n=1 Tax=Thiosulfatimonas sediminis TaxID=2675054 RepID=A0A6F8PU30_9GAMM|nr:flagellar hook-basal body complex protein FliE [Thiosulfatimonas sediminis]BBP45537.1 flagellar hook-basal body complex protein FliE [Thiosulfatimonas sediminis]